MRRAAEAAGVEAKMAVDQRREAGPGEGQGACAGLAWEGPGWPGSSLCGHRVCTGVFLMQK